MAAAAAGALVSRLRKRGGAAARLALRAVLCGALVAWVVRRLRIRRMSLQLPRAPCISSHWLLGNFGHVLLRCARVPRTDNRPDIMATWAQAAEETRKQGLFHMSFGHWLLPLYTELNIVHDWKMVKQLLSKEYWGLFRKGLSYRIAGDLIGSRALLSAPDSEHWRWQRRLSSAAFRRGMLDSALVPSVWETVEELCERWEGAAGAAGGERPVVDFYEDALALTINVLGKFAFGFDFGGGGGGAAEGAGGGGKRPLNDAFECVLHHMTYFARNPLLYATRHVNRKYQKGLGTIDQAVRATIDCRLSGGKVGDDLLGQLLKAAEAEGEKQMDHGLIVDNLKTFLFAGHDTTASTLAWAVHLLATHPEEEALLLQELRALPLTAPEGREGGRPMPSAEALDALPYLEAVVKETLRLYPPAGFTREPLQDIDIGGYRLRKGTELFFFPYLTQRDPRLFPEPEVFRPRRWLKEEAGSPLAMGVAPESVGWMPFSLGARNCVGAQLARLEIKAALHALLSRYSFEPAPDDGLGPPTVVLYMTLVPNAVRVVPRLRAD